MRQFYGVDPTEYSFVNAAVRLGLSKTKGRKTFFAFREIQSIGLVRWQAENSATARLWQCQIIVEAGYDKILEGYEPQIDELVDVPPEQQKLF